MKREFFEVGLALLSGTLTPIQATINAGLIDPLHNFIAPAAVSFTFGALVLSIVFFYDPRKDSTNAEISTLDLLKSIKKHLLVFPGMIGAYGVTLSAVLGRELGFSLFFVALISGQLLSSTLLDHFGLLGVKIIKATAFRLTCLALLLIGSIIAVFERIDLNQNGAQLILFMLLALSAGLIGSMQIPLNAEVQRHMNSLAHRASWWSFVTGAIFLIIVTAISGLFSTVDSASFKEVADIEWWHFLGGLLGAIFVTCSVFLGPRLGLGLYTVCVIAGQLFSSLMIDAFGLLDSEKLNVTTARICGVLIVFCSVAAFRFEDRIKSLFSRQEISNDATVRSDNKSQELDV